MKKTSTRYNLSRIMTRAWKRYRNGQEVYKGRDKETHTFSLCLKLSWDEEKEIVTLREAEQNGVDFEQNMAIKFVCMPSVTLNRWSKYGHDRLYFNGCAGWYDIAKKEFHGKKIDSRLERFVSSLRFPALWA